MWFGHFPRSGIKSESSLFIKCYIINVLNFLFGAIRPKKALKKWVSHCIFKKWFGWGEVCFFAIFFLSKKAKHPWICPSFSGDLILSLPYYPFPLFQCPSSLGQINPTVGCIACPWLRVFFLLNTARILDGRAWLYSSEVSYSYCMGLHNHPCITIYPNSWSPSFLALVQHTQPGLWPNPHVGWPLGLWHSAKRILQCAALHAPGG